MNHASRGMALDHITQLLGSWRRGGFIPSWSPSSLGNLAKLIKHPPELQDLEVERIDAVSCANNEPG